jgi:hypothetical protein
MSQRLALEETLLFNAPQALQTRTEIFFFFAVDWSAPQRNASTATIARLDERSAPESRT